MKIIVIGFILIITFNLYGQGIPYNQEFQVNTIAIDLQRLPSVAGLKDSGFVVCWESRVYNGYGYNFEIFGQAFDASPTKKGDEFMVNTYMSDNQEHPSVSGLSDSRFVVCWQSWGQDGSANGIFGQLFKVPGAKTGHEFQVNSYTYHDQLNPAIAALQDGGFVVCWQSYWQDSSDWGIYCQKFNPLGEKIDSEFQINVYTKGAQEYPSVAGLKDGGFVVCWDSWKEDTDDRNIYCQVFESSGARRGSEFQVNTLADHNQWYSTVAGLEDGGFVVCWECDKQDGSSVDIFCQIFDSACRKIGDELQLNTYTEDWQGRQCITSFTNGRFVVIWQSMGQDGSGWGIFAQLFDANGVKIGDEFRVNNYTSGWQCQPTVSSFQDNRFVVCWTSAEQDGSFYGIFGKYFSAEPIIHPLHEFSLIEPLNDATLNTTRPLFSWTQPSTIRESLPWEITFELHIASDFNFLGPQIISSIQDTIFKVDYLAAGKTYFWKVLAKNLAGDSLWSTQQDWGFYIHPGATSVESGEQNLPSDFGLFQNYPNPFNSSTIIKYSLTEKSDVSVKIYNVNGRLVDDIILNNLEPGEHEFQWTPRSLTSGVYLIKVQTRNWRKTIKAMLLK